MTDERKVPETEDPEVNERDFEDVEEEEEDDDDEENEEDTEEA